MPELTVVVQAKAKPGKEAELEKTWEAIIGPTHQEPGCLSYVLHRAVDDPAVFISIERWESKEAIDQHFATRHVQALLRRVPDLVAGAPEIKIFELISGGRLNKGT
ncbi:MAG: antibiotic biosynthesis monooxygenase [Candidatus Manganitrophus sp. SA1]|nr:antibiotic biosynthesis monooxygenase [Candidatus Manganitrophus morganii]